jgi:anti-anti-sigma factor
VHRRGATLARPADFVIYSQASPRAQETGMKMIEDSLGGDVLRVALEGRLDVDGAEGIGARFAAAMSAHAGPLAVDLSQVSFIASVGIRMILTAARERSQRGGRTVLVGPPGMGTQVLRIAGVDLVVPLVADLDSARASLDAA